MNYGYGLVAVALTLSCGTREARDSQRAAPLQQPSAPPSPSSTPDASETTPTTAETDAGASHDKRPREWRHTTPLPAAPATQPARFFVVKAERSAESAKSWLETARPMGETPLVGERLRAFDKAGPVGEAVIVNVKTEKHDGCKKATTYVFEADLVPASGVTYDESDEVLLVLVDRAGPSAARASFHEYGGLRNPLPKGFPNTKFAEAAALDTNQDGLPDLVRAYRGVNAVVQRKGSSWETEYCEEAWSSTAGTWSQTRRFCWCDWEHSY